MFGSLILLAIILISSLPIIAVYIWFRVAKYHFPLSRFLLTLLAGSAAFFPALLMQDFLSLSSLTGRMALFFQYFIRIAFTEELSRFFLLLIFFFIYNRITSRKSGQLSKNQPPSINTIKMATATGLVAGLGFALLENAVYAAADIRVLPLRIIITAAVHAACGSRVGVAAVTIRTNPLQAILRIFTATAIHGIYNLMIVMPGFSPIAAILIALSALFSAIFTIRGGWLDSLAEDPKDPIQDQPITAEPPPDKRTLDKPDENSVS